MSKFKKKKKVVVVKVPSASTSMLDKKLLQITFCSLLFIVTRKAQLTLIEQKTATFFFSLANALARFLQ